MALTTEQQAQLEFSQAQSDINTTAQLALESKRARLEAIRLAKEVLIENNRTKPSDEREVSASDITTLAASLVNYIEN